MDEIERKASDPHPDYPGLTYGDVDKAQKKAKEKAEAARRQSAMDRAVADELARLEREEGLNVEGGNMVRLRLNLCPTMKELRIDGRLYQHGREYTVPEAKARDMLYMQYKGWEQESARKGDDKYAFYAQMQQQQAAPLVVNRAGALIGGRMPQGTH